MQLRRRVATRLASLIGLLLLLLVGGWFFLFASQPGGEHLMWRAAVTGNHRLASVLVIDEGTVNVRDRNGWNPLMIAAAWGHTATVRVLMKRGSALNFQDRFGFTALARASHRGYGDVVAMLLQSGADPNLTDEEGNTALMLAASRGTLGFANVSLEAQAGGANWGHIEPKRNNYDNIITDLITHGANWNLRNSEGKSVLDIARDRGDAAMVARLKRLEKGEGPSFYPSRPVREQE